MWQQGQVFKLKAKGSRSRRTGTGSRGAARRGHRLADSRLELTHRSLSSRGWREPLRTSASAGVPRDGFNFPDLICRCAVAQVVAP
jgi:hypothetical protein